jgi:hypothetical protein
MATNYFLQHVGVDITCTIKIERREPEIDPQTIRCDFRLTKESERSCRAWCPLKLLLRSITFWLKMGTRISSEERGEDPFVVALDAVVGYDGVALAATRNAEKGSR